MCIGSTTIEEEFYFCRDIAARNLLVSSVPESNSYQIRLSDFGMARQVSIGCCGNS